MGIKKVDTDYLRVPVEVVSLEGAAREAGGARGGRGRGNKSRRGRGGRGGRGGVAVESNALRF